jgi:type IV pilus assembly protein PilV
LNIARKTQLGVSLIELLIALVVLSVGMLGMASMEIQAKRLAFDAAQRSQAVALADDMLERMRGNPTALSNYVVNNLGGGSIGTEPTPNCKSASCSGAALAAHDLWEWERALNGAAETITSGGTTTNVGGLDSPRACITNTNGYVELVIVWKGRTETANPAGSSCGEGLGLYGTNEAARQKLEINTFIEVL